MNVMNCTACNGTGKASYDDARACYKCEGRGTFPELDVTAVVNAVFTTRGKRRFRKSMTSPLRRDGVNATRAYYVWRLARFHGGADVTMPMMADLLIGGDPARSTLDKVAEIIATRVFGTDMAAAYRWGSALGMTPSVPAGLPSTAYPCGPVHDGNDSFTVAMLAMGD